MKTKFLSIIFCLISLSVMGQTNGTITRKKKTTTTTSTNSGKPKPQTPVKNQTSSKGNKTFMANGVSFTMVYIKGGSFTMGATSEQGSDAYDDEKPTHGVTLSNYMIGQTEVTQELWQAVMGSNPSHWKGKKLPVESVSWEECQKFISRLNSITGQKFRLPTEEEWEYAARGGECSQGYKYPGSNNPDMVIWHIDNSEEKTHSIGQKKANELGIYDMGGNVWEFCQDFYGSYKRGTLKEDSKVIRGGSCCDGTNHCRNSRRFYFYQKFKDKNVGLRLAL